MLPQLYAPSIAKSIFSFIIASFIITSFSRKCKVYCDWKLKIIHLDANNNVRGEEFVKNRCEKKHIRFISVNFVFIYDVYNQHQLIFCCLWSHCSFCYRCAFRLILLQLFINEEGSHYQYTLHRSRHVSDFFLEQNTYGIYRRYYPWNQRRISSHYSSLYSGCRFFPIGKNFHPRKNSSLQHFPDMLLFLCLKTKYGFTYGCFCSFNSSGFSSVVQNHHKAQKSRNNYSKSTFVNGSKINQKAKKKSH